MRLYRRVFSLAALTVVASCAAPPSAPPSLPPVAPAPPPSADWRDWPVSAGDWHYAAVAGGSIASFGESGARTQLSLRCDKAGRRIVVTRAVSAQVIGQMTLRTSSGAIGWPIDSSTERQAVAVRLASDAAFDQMAFSRGRFAIEVPGETPLVVPNWAEVGRVIEDCRG